MRSHSIITPGSPFQSDKTESAIPSASRERHTTCAFRQEHRVSIASPVQTLGFAG